MGQQARVKTTIQSVLFCLTLIPAITQAAVVWKAYNDCMTIPLGSTQPNVTRYTMHYDRNLNLVDNYTGPLKNYSSGSTADMPTVTFSMAGSGILVGSGGGNFNAGTPADQIFGGILDFGPEILRYSDTAGWAQEIEFSNLNPALTYTFVGTAVRTSDYSDRQTKVTISGHESANNFSTGAMIVQKSPSFTIFKAADNTISGSVVRWDDIVCGTDGKFTIRSEAYGINQAYPLNGFMLQAVGPDNQPPVVDAGEDLEITLPVFKALMDASVTDDGLGSPDGYLGYQWSVFSGPGTVTFVPNANVEDPEACVELDQPGDYVLRLTATDGELTDFDDVHVTVHPPVCPIGDLNGDCLVDIEDLEVFALQWLQTPVGNADLTDNGSVDLTDYSWLAGTWQENQQKGALQVTINPEAARNRALWRVDGDVWRPSGDITPALSVGAHTVEFLSLENFDAPASQNVNILYNQTTQAVGTYTPHVGSLQVDISPTEVVSSARWRRVGQTAWRTSGSEGREDGVLVGVHYVEFNVVSAWLKPPVTEVVVSQDALTTIDAGYTDLGTVSLRINEFMADNSTDADNDPVKGDILGNDIKDEYGEFDDWIEIYNMADESVDLAGLYIADDSTMHQIPAGYATQTTVPSGGYIILWADNQTSQGPLHLPFKLDAGGDAITLYHADGLTEIDSIIFGSQVYNHSYGRFPDGANDCYFFTPPTFNASNSYQGIANRVADTKFSPNRGFYTDPFTVLITSDTPEASIYYTTDASDPINPDGTPTATAVLYSESTKPYITTTTCLRAAAVKTGLIPTNIDTHTYIFLEDVFKQATDPVTEEQVLPAGYPAIWPGASYGPETGDYQVDPEIVNHSNPENQLTVEDMLSVPTICVTMHKDHWFGVDPAIGIYVNQSLNYNVPESKEYACSFEYIDPSRGKAVQQNCAIAMQGGVSGGGTSLQRWKTFKLSMRPRFKQTTDDGTVTGGGGKLSFRFFADSPVKDFDTIVLDAVLNNAWLHRWNQPGRYVTDQVTADFHNVMGGYSPHGAYAHVYINGLYWGMYYIHERPDHSWAAEMFGGDKEEYDCIKHERTGVVNPDWPLSSRATNNYDAMLAAASNAGSNSTSLTAWQVLEDQLDVDNLITYLLANWFAANTDWPHKNWYATCRVGGQWRYHSWDAEHTFANAGENKVGSSPDTVHGRLLNHIEYKMRFADHIHKHFHNGGPLSYPRSWQIYQARMSEIDQAIRGESGRWGDRCYDGASCYTIPKTRTDWLNTEPQRTGAFFTNRSDTVFNQLSGLYPATLPPDFSVNGSAMYGGYVDYNDSLTMTNPNGTGIIYYMLNGQDPRLPGGAVNPAAQSFGGSAVPLTHSVHVKARVRSAGGQWSALSEAVFAVGPVAESLRITELMYHPADPPISDPNAEFIELKNIGSETINLSMVRFTNGVDLEIPYLRLEPGAYAVVVQDPNAFKAQYDTSSNFPRYTGRLDNGGERIVLTDARGQTIHDFSYKDGWYDITDGGGFSLTIKDPNATDLSLWDQKAGWRPSGLAGGSPGWDDSGLVPELGSIVINEILAHSHGVAPDWIELYNTTGQPINISGWFLSDSDADDLNRKKYRIAEGTSIPAYGYLVFYQDQHFGNAGNPDCLDPFAFSEGGETAYLFSGDGTVLTGYVEEESFGASETNVAFGRYYKASTDTYNFVPMSTNTPGAANAYPKVGPIVISEIMYHPPAGGTYDNDEYEYLELRNITSQAVALQEYDDQQSIYVPWKLTDGVDYTFPLGVTVPANGTIVVVKNISAFGDRYPSVPAGKIYGPYSGKLSNGGEKVELSKPGDEEVGVRYYIRVDRVVYSDGSHPVGSDPWPAAADGAGKSLHRINNSEYGNDYINWEAADPTPAQ